MGQHLIHSQTHMHRKDSLCNLQTCFVTPDLVSCQQNVKIMLFLIMDLLCCMCVCVSVCRSGSNKLLFGVGILKTSLRRMEHSLNRRLNRREGRARL